MLSAIQFTPPGGSPITLHSSVASTSLVTYDSHYSITRAEGIFGTPETRDLVRVAPGRDGSIDDTHFLSERKITLEGEILGSTPADVLSRWQTMSSAFQLSLLQPGKLTITLADGTSQRWTNVILSGSAQPSLEGGSAYLQYQLTLRAPDPRWYGMTLNTSSSSVTVTSGTSPVTSSAVTVTNAGTAPSLPVVSFTGALTATGTVTVTVPNPAYTNISPQGATIPLVMQSLVGATTYTGTVDCGLKTVSGVYVDALTEWPILYPGSSSWTLKVNATPVSSQSFSAQVSWYDAWW